MTPAASNIAWPPEARHAAYRVLAEHGIGGLEIAPGLFFWNSDDPFRPDAAEAERALVEISGAGLHLVSMQSLLYGVEGAALFGDAEARARFHDGMRRAIDLASRFGIPNLVFGSPAQRRSPDAMEPAEALEQAADAFRTLGDLAAAAGTTIAVEPNPAAYGTNFLTKLGETTSFVRAVGHDAVRINLDLGERRLNAASAGGDTAVEDALPLVNHVHVSEPHLAPAPHDLDQLAPALSALRTSGYNGAISLEMKPGVDAIATLRRSLVSLRDALEPDPPR